MRKELSIKQQVHSGFRHAGGWLLGMAWLGLVFWGIVEAFGTEANFSAGHHPSRGLGYFILGAAAVIFLITANVWKRVFPGIMLAATLGAVVELARGHAVNNPSLHIPRWIAFIQLLVIVGVTAISSTLKERPLSTIDRFALLTFAASIYLGGEEVTQQKMPFALIVGGICVLIAWAIDRLKPNQKLPRSAVIQ
jgi:hypothetical protein